MRVSTEPTTKRRGRLDPVQRCTSCKRSGYDYCLTKEGFVCRECARKNARMDWAAAYWSRGYYDYAFQNWPQEADTLAKRDERKRQERAIL